MKRYLPTLGLFLACAGVAQAQLTWDNGAANGQWNTSNVAPFNWNNTVPEDVAWTNSSGAVFGVIGLLEIVNGGKLSLIMPATSRVGKNRPQN
jgi:hypothetical protein